MIGPVEKVNRPEWRAVQQMTETERLGIQRVKWRAYWQAIRDIGPNASAPRTGVSNAGGV